jgi:hypothetical protein
MKTLIVSCYWTDADSDEALEAVATEYAHLKVEGTKGYAVAAPEDDEWAQEFYSTRKKRHEEMVEDASGT